MLERKIHPGKSNALVIYLIKFLGLFGLLFYGTEAVIALASPGNHYSALVADHLNFIPSFRIFLLKVAQILLSTGGWQVNITDAYTLSFTGGASVRMVYSCLGYGVLSFWVAFVFANKGSWQKKGWWMLGGCMVLTGINTIRIALILLASQKGWQIPFGWDHHTWFNIVAYLLIFAMIMVYDRSEKREKVELPISAHIEKAF